jgi:hypothetical protein
MTRTSPVRARRALLEFASSLAFGPRVVDRDRHPWLPALVRKAASIRLGLLLAVSALLTSCSREKPDERRCVDADGRYVDEGRCLAGERAGEFAADGGVAGGSTGGWDQADGGAPQGRGGYHFIWIPYGAFGGMGALAPAHLRSGTGGASPSGSATSGSVSRGGFGATGAAHAGSATAGT